MDIALAALIAILAFWAGAGFGYQQGVEYGVQQARIRARLAAMGGERVSSSPPTNSRGR